MEINKNRILSWEKDGNRFYLPSLKGLRIVSKKFKKLFKLPAYSYSSHYLSYDDLKIFKSANSKNLTIFFIGVTTSTDEVYHMISENLKLFYTVIVNASSDLAEINTNNFIIENLKSAIND